MSRGTLLRIAVTLLILGWLCYRLNWAELAATMRTLRVGVWIGALALGVVVQMLLSFRWWLLSRPLGFNDNWPRYLQLYLVGLYFNLFMPTVVGGDVVRAWYLDGNRGKRPLALVSVFVEQSSNMLTLLALGLIAALVSWSSLPRWILPVVIVVCGGALLLMTVVVGIAPWASRRLAPAQSRVGCFLRDYVRTFAEAVAVYRRCPGVFFGSLLLAAGIHVLNVATSWLTARALGIDVSLGYMMIVIPLLAALLLVPISISGIGVRETSLGMFLAPRGIAQAASVSLGLMTFFNLVLVSLTGGAIYTLGRFPKLNFKSPSVEEPAVPIESAIAYNEKAMLEPSVSSEST